MAEYYFFKLRLVFCVIVCAVLTACGGSATETPNSAASPKPTTPAPTSSSRVSSSAPASSTSSTQSKSSISQSPISSQPASSYQRASRASLPSSSAITSSASSASLMPASSRSSSLSSASSTASSEAPSLLQVRVEGLKLGQALTIRQLNESFVINQNGGHQLNTKSATDLQIVDQPKDQHCTIEESASTQQSPLLIYCKHQTSASITMPATQPDEPLAVSFDWRDTAYPGVVYDSRPGVIGGIFPYEFRIKQFTIDGSPQPTTDIDLDFRRGTLRFTPTLEGTYAFTLSIRDSGATPKQLEYTTQIKVNKTAFIFVDEAGVDAANRGARETPYQTLQYALTQSRPDQVIYLRKGIYAANGIKLRDDKAKQLLAYANETVILNMNTAGNLSVNSSTLPMARIEGVHILNVKQYGIVSDPSKAGLVIRKVTFVNGEEGPNKSENPAFIHAWGDTASATRHKFLVQENQFGTYSGAGYATTFFDVGNSIIENNQLKLGKVNGGFHDKDNSQNNVYRENYIEFSPVNKTAFGIQVSAQSNSENVHIHHNLLINAGVYLGIQCFQATCYMRNHDVHHNTLINGRVSLNWGPFNPTSAGSRVSHNIIIARAATAYGGLSCQARPANLATQFAASHNLIETTNLLAFKDTDCTGNDMNWSVWQNTYALDTTSSGSSIMPSIPLTGAGPTTGLAADDTRITRYGHQY